MSPNPATTELQISVDSDKPVKSYIIYDITGRTVRSTVDVNSSNFVVNRQTLQNGLYIIKLQFESGILSKKVLFE